jgi:nicotinic acid mononucleotide adenylyltransferase
MDDWQIERTYWNAQAKIERDPYYNDIYNNYKRLHYRNTYEADKYCLSRILEAGFFLDSDKSNYDITKSLNVLCTPIHHIKENLKNSKNPCILLSTGAMCPVHNGHIETMIQAKKAVEENDFTVIGGYLSPGHDEYIYSKIKDKAIPAYHRIKLINDAVKDIDWLFVDPWEALFCKVAVNFTDVIQRLQLYLKQHLGVEIPIFFVCGSDNARFSKTFTFKGHCVVVKRPGYEKAYEEHKSLFDDNYDIIFCDGNNDNSSTKVRENLNIELSKKELKLRVEDSDDKYSPLQTDIISKLNEQFISIKENSVSEQKDKISGILEKINKTDLCPVISLDSLITCENNLQISRYYDTFGINKIGYTNRIGSIPLQEQIDSLDRNKYILFDDDVHTGKTVLFVTDLLKQNEIDIKCSITLNISFNDESEILDCRDFIIGEANNGLTIELPNGIKARVPYIYPYVCPYIRASILDPMGFSIDIWKLNMDFYENKNELLKDHSYLKAFEYIGFKPEDSLYNICKWHYDYLIELLNK